MIGKVVLDSDATADEVDLVAELLHNYGIDSKPHAVVHRRLPDGLAPWTTRIILDTTVETFLGFAIKSAVGGLAGLVRGLIDARSTSRIRTRRHRLVRREWLDRCARLRHPGASYRSASHDRLGDAVRQRLVVERGNGHVGGRL